MPSSPCVRYADLYKSIKWIQGLEHRLSHRQNVDMNETMSGFKEYFIHLEQVKHPFYQLCLYLHLRCGILQLEIETGKCQNKPVEERICKVCGSGEVENEFHFIFSYTL